MYFIIITIGTHLGSSVNLSNNSSSHNSFHPSFAITLGLGYLRKNLFYNNATAILYASLHNQKEPIQLLLAAGASIHDITINGVSCFTATYNNDIKLIFKQ